MVSKALTVRRSERTLGIAKHLADGTPIYTRRKGFTTFRIPQKISHTKYHAPEAGITKEDLFTERMLKRLLQEKKVSEATKLATDHIEKLMPEFRVKLEILNRLSELRTTSDLSRIDTRLIDEIDNKLPRIMNRILTILQYVPVTNPVRRQLITTIKAIQSNPAYQIIRRYFSTKIQRYEDNRLD